MSTKAQRELAAIEAAVKDVCERGRWLVEADWDYFDAVEPTVEIRRIRGWWEIRISVVVRRDDETTAAFEKTTKCGLDWCAEDVAAAVDQSLVNVCEADRKYGELTAETVKLIEMQRWAEVLTGKAR